MNLHKTTWIFILISVATIQSTLAQKEKFHSIFLYNFSKYIKWPDEKIGDKFVIGVYGKSSILDDLRVMEASKKVNGVPVKVVSFNSIEETNQCNILYITDKESGKIDQILKVLKNSPILIVTDQPGLAKRGSNINFVESHGKIKFELNQSVTEKKGLKVAGSLASLAIVV